MTAEEIGLVAGEHALGVIRVGVGVIGKVVFGQIQTLIRLRSVLAHVNAVFDHVCFAGRGSTEGPAGVVIALIIDRGDIAVIPAVVGRRQFRLLQTLLRCGAVRRSRAAMRELGKTAQSVLGVVAPGLVRFERGSFGERRGNETQDQDRRQQNGEDPLQDRVHVFSPSLWLRVRIQDLTNTI